MTTAALVVSTPEGDRLDDAAIVAKGTELGVTVTSEISQLIHAVFDAAAFKKDTEVVGAETEHKIATELDLVRRVEHLIAIGEKAGFTFTVADVNGKLVPAVQKKPAA